MGRTTRDAAEDDARSPSPAPVGRKAHSEAGSQPDAGVRLILDEYIWCPAVGAFLAVLLQDVVGKSWLSPDKLRDYSPPTTSIAAILPVILAALGVGVFVTAGETR